MADKKFVYKNKKRKPKGNLPAQVVGEELERIHKKNGELTASAVVSESEPKTAPLHKAFTWDNALAGHQYRLNESRSLIKTTQVEVQVEEAASAIRPAYIHVPTLTHGEGTYCTAGELSNDLEKWQRAYGEALRRVRGSEQAVRELRAITDGSENKDLAASLAGVLESLQLANRLLDDVSH